MSREFKDAGCEGKQSFVSPELAVRAARRRPGRLAYRCAFCGLWHAGRPKSPKAERARPLAAELTGVWIDECATLSPEVFDSLLTHVKRLK